MEYKQYYLATQMLKDEMQNANYAEAKARKAFLIGRSESKMGNWSDALYWYEKAFDFGFGNEALYQSGEALLRLERYEAAQNLFRQLYREEPTNERFRKALVRARLVRQRLQEPDRDTVEIINWAQNSPHRDFSLSIQGDNLYFSFRSSPK